MDDANTDLLADLLRRLRYVQTLLQMEPVRDEAVDDALADQLDSMGLVEFIATLAQDCHVSVERIEQILQKCGTLRQLAATLQQDGIEVKNTEDFRQEETQSARSLALPAFAWLTAPTLQLPQRIQPAEEINALLNRPASWLQKHAGIFQRHIWDTQDPLEAAAQGGRDCLRQCGLRAKDVKALLVTSEAPPLLSGLAAAVHHRLGLPIETPALEAGGACTGFLHALWLCRYLLSEKSLILVIALEAHSRHLLIKPGPVGEAAALFGDAAFACAVTPRPLSENSLPLVDVQLWTHGELAHLLHVTTAPDGGQIHMKGPQLASRAIRTMAGNVGRLLQKHDLTPDNLQAVIAHGGNGRMPALVAHQLHFPANRVWSETAMAGNLGSISLPAAWAAREDVMSGLVAWTSVGAGLSSAVALTGPPGESTSKVKLPL